MDKMPAGGERTRQDIRRGVLLGRGPIDANPALRTSIKVWQLGAGCSDAEFVER